jgi:hypothetical protein
MKAGAACISAIAVDEIPQKMWPDLIQTLCNASLHENFSFRMASLLTLGYISEDLDIQYISVDEMNSILYAVLSNLSSGNQELARIASVAFDRAAPFTARNF